jgi:hypothetical protein
MPRILAFEEIDGRLMVEIEKPSGEAGSCSLYSEAEASALHRQIEAAENVALEYVELCGKLSAIVEWCVTNDGETLGDNPQQLAYARRVLVQAHAKRSD